jgi:hypothetical protein
MEGLTLVDAQRIVEAVVGGTITKMETVMQCYAPNTVQHVEITVEAKAAPTILLRIPVSTQHYVEGIVVDEPTPENQGQTTIYDHLPQETPKNPAMQADPERVYASRVDTHDSMYGYAEVTHKPGCPGIVRWYKCAGALRGHCQQCDALSAKA